MTSSTVLSGGVAALALTCVSAGAATPPPGFVDLLLVQNNVSTGAASPVAVAYEPGSGNLWVLEKGGGGSARVRVRAAVTGGFSTALTLGCLDSAGERGLLGIAFSPDYLEAGGASRHVYLFYTRRFASSGLCSVGGEPAGSRNRVSRFSEGGGVLSGEEVVLEGPYLTAATNHNGGTLRFAPDKTLFISMGDNDTDAVANPLSRDLGDLRGKLLRSEEIEHSHWCRPPQHLVTPQLGTGVIRDEQGGVVCGIGGLGQTEQLVFPQAYRLAGSVLPAHEADRHRVLTRRR